MLDFFAKPLGKLLKLVYDFFVSIGLDLDFLSAYALAIIFTTIIFKLLLVPLSMKQTKSMKDMEKIKPKLTALQKKYKEDPKKLNEETMKLYKEHNVSPFGGCLPILIQFPILIAYFRVMREPVKYVFLDQKYFDGMNKAFFWIKDIAEKPTAKIAGEYNDLAIMGVVIPVMAIISALTTYFSSKISTPQSTDGNDKAQSTQKMMLYFMPLMFLFFGYKYPSGFTIYWTVSNLFQIFQYKVLNKIFDKEKS